MSARNMVRNLRDTGALEAQTPSPRIRPILATVLAGLAFGLVVYFAGTIGGPALLDAMRKDPPPVHFAKP